MFGFGQLEKMKRRLLDGYLASFLYVPAGGVPAFRKGPSALTKGSCTGMVLGVYETYLPRSLLLGYQNSPETANRS